MGLLLWYLLSLGCSDPVYYPSITSPFPGSAGFYASEDSGTGGDTDDTGVSGGDWAGLEAVPCGDEVLGADTWFTVNNTHAGTVWVWERRSDCSMLELGELPAGVVQDQRPAGVVYAFTDRPETRVLAWLRVTPEGTASVVVP